VKYYGVELHRVRNHVFITDFYSRKRKTNDNFYFNPELEITILLSKNKDDSGSGNTK